MNVLGSVMVIGVLYFSVNKRAYGLSGEYFGEIAGSVHVENYYLHAVLAAQRGSGEIHDCLLYTSDAADE